MTKRADATQAVLYCRCSTEEQSLEGYSIELQQAALQAYCAMRGLEVVAVVVDAGVSGSKPLETREGGRELQALVAKRAVGAVVGWRLDRLFRSASDALSVTEAWDKRGVALHLVNLGGQAVDISSSVGRFFLCILAGVAELERNQICERTSAALQVKRAKGERLGQIPFGYRLSPDSVTLERDPDEQQVIALILSMRQAGLSIARIAERLNADHVKARGQRWHATSVRRVLARAA